MKMTIREYYVGVVPLAVIGEIMDENMLQKSIAKRVNQLRRHCPVFKKLACSILVYRLEPLPSGIGLRYYLQEKSQDSFGMPISGGPNIFEANDKFKAEVQSALIELARAPTALKLACNPAVDPDELYATTTSANEKKALRAAAKVDRGGTVPLPGLERPSNIQVPTVPKFLPLGKVLKVSALVVKLPKGKATLTKIRLIGHDGSETLDPSIPNQINLIRRAAGPRARFNHLLLEAMDQKIRVNLEVTAVANWTDASLAMFDLIDARPLYGPYPQKQGGELPDALPTSNAIEI
jgi:hypothetical protein